MSPDTSPTLDAAAALLEAQRREIEKLRRINAVLIDRVERSMEHQANAYSLFQTAIGLETQVRARTEELKNAMHRLERLNAELVSARDTAEQASRFKTRFFTAVGHDILQPLHAARLSLSALADTGLDAGSAPRRARSPTASADARAAPLFHRIDQSLEQVEEMLRTLLDLSRLEAGAFKPDVRGVELASMLAMLQASAEGQAQTKGLRLAARPTSLAVASDQLMLRRILQNLMANAIHYTTRGGVLLAARRRGDTVRIEVWDTGPGIAPEEQSMIFEEFQRGSTAERGAGFGLGLSIAQRMAAALDHPLSLCSRPGHGSCFMVTAPFVSQAPAASNEVSPTPAAASYGFSGARVLLIENDDAVRQAMVDLLQRWSFEVLPCASLADLSTPIADRRYRPDIVIADYHLDFGQSGLAGVRRLRSAYSPSLPAVVITADRSETTAEEARAERCELLFKPVRPAELRALLSHLLN